MTQTLDLPIITGSFFAGTFAVTAKDFSAAVVISF
jgi:hypothetical protein